MSMIAQRKLGRSGLSVSAVGFGAAPLGDLYRLLDDKLAVEATEAAINAGMTLVDTSPLYGHGLSEHRVGTAIRRAGRDNVVLSTKVGRWMTPARGAWDREGYAGGLPFAATLDYSYDGTLRSLEQSLLRLGTDRVDIALIHDVDRRNHGDALDQRFAEAVNGAWKALARLRDEGVVKAIGIGVNEVEVCLAFAEQCDMDCLLLAGRYSLLEQGALDALFPLAQTRGIGILLGGVFNSGILATGPVTGAMYDYAPAAPGILGRVRQIEATCHRHGVTLATAAMQFVRHHPVVASVVLGAVTPAEVERNLAGWASAVPADLWQELKTLGLIDPRSPTGEG